MNFPSTTLNLATVSCFLLPAAILAATGIPATASYGADRPPNIIFINADDLGWTDLSVQGSGYYESPHIDRLAAQGMRFTDAYAPASNCSPSRASVLTGTYMPRHGRYTNGTSARGEAKDRKLIPIENNRDFGKHTVTIAEVLSAHGYITTHMGKWHLGPDPLAHGFAYNIAGGVYGSPVRYGYHSPYHFPNCVQEEEGEYLTDRLGSEAVRFIEEYRDRPFFLYFATYTVHTPIQAKEEIEARYREKEPTEAHYDPAYAAMIQSLDENVGRILKTLEELGLEEKTLVLFTSDNGGVWPISKQWPLRAGKGSYYEGGTRVPLIARWPGVIEAGTISHEPVVGVDFFPTFLEAAGVEKPSTKVLDGESLMPLLAGTGELSDRALYWHFPIYLQPYIEDGPVETRDPLFRTRPGSVIRYGDWKLHEYFEDGGLELYNLAEDIGESNNLTEEKPEKAAELLAMLRAWREEIGAPVPTELNPAYVP